VDKRTPINAGVTVADFWTEPVNVPEPMRYTDDFDTNLGYFTEENGAHDFHVENGCLTAAGDNNGALAYLQIYEKNVTYRARFKYTSNAQSGAFLSFLLRYSSPEAYVRLSYYHKSRSWAIIGSEGKDFPLYRYAHTEDFPIEPDTWHDIEFTLDKDTAEAYLDGRLLFTANSIHHTTPGRVGIAADNMTVFVDSVDIAFNSNQGTLMRGVKHTRLPGEKYLEGGSVTEMSDGKLIYQHAGGDTFTSADNGVTWQRAEHPWTELSGTYPQILRLMSGELIKVIDRNIDGVKYKFAVTSADDGKTWDDAGAILSTPWRENSGCNALNMNDKINQISTGRIFYCQNYHSAVEGKTTDGRIVFCEFYYSDDMGRTWTKSETDTWTIKGNEDAKWFGECKILECSDGSLRVYNSWNDYGCVVYAESFDGGKTFGELKKLPELVCARSSMQFHRDLYDDCPTSYYMVLVYSKPFGKSYPMSRSRLSLFHTVDGKTWDFLGDLWRWETDHMAGSHLCHAVDPFIKTTKDYVICGSGFSEHKKVEGERGSDYHHAQRQHIYSIPKAYLKAVPLTDV